jgi:hypothetical protein
MDGKGQVETRDVVGHGDDWSEREKLDAPAGKGKADWIRVEVED